MDKKGKAVVVSHEIATSGRRTRRNLKIPRAVVVRALGAVTPKLWGSSKSQEQRIRFFVHKSAVLGNIKTVHRIHNLPGLLWEGSELEGDTRQSIEG